MTAAQYLILVPVVVGATLALYFLGRRPLAGLRSHPPPDPPLPRWTGDALFWAIVGLVGLTVGLLPGGLIALALILHFEYKRKILFHVKRGKEDPPCR